jgi:diketogulonate reductase-like aldo/keto reductase
VAPRSRPCGDEETAGDVVALIEELGSPAVVLGSPTDTGGPEAARRVLEPIASRHGAAISQIALAWLLARSPAIMPVPGTTSIAHVRENLDAQDIELSPEDIQSMSGYSSLSKVMGSERMRRPVAW